MFNYLYLWFKTAVILRLSTPLYTHWLPKVRYM